MTVKELIDKLSIYNGDEQIFTGEYDDLRGVTYFAEPMFGPQEVQAHSNEGYISYTQHSHCEGLKQDTILVIGGF